MCAEGGSLDVPVVRCVEVSGMLGSWSQCAVGCCCASCLWQSFERNSNQVYIRIFKIAFSHDIVPKYCANDAIKSASKGLCGKTRIKVEFPLRREVDKGHVFAKLRKRLRTADNRNPVTSMMVGRLSLLRGSLGAGNAEVFACPAKSPLNTNKIF